MPADVQIGVHLPVPVADNQNRVLSHVGGEKVSRIGNLAFMAEEGADLGVDRVSYVKKRIGYIGCPEQQDARL